MPELGKKYECAECGAKFYDLGKPDPICPRCGTNQKDVEKTAPEPRPRYVAPKAAVAAATVVEPEDDEAVAGIGDEDDEILEVEPGEEEEEEEEEDEE